MAKSNKKEGKLGTWLGAVEVAKAMKEGPMASAVIDLEDIVPLESPEQLEATPQSQIDFEGMPVEGGYIPKGALFPSDEPEDVHVQYIGSETIKYTQ